MTNKTYIFNIGIDISKKTLDVSFNAQETASFDNNLSGFKQLLKQIKNKQATRVVMEATGGYEKALVDFLQKKGVAVSIVNAKRVRDYAKALGKLAKQIKLIRMLFVFLLRPLIQKYQNPKVNYSNR